MLALFCCIRAIAVYNIKPEIEKPVVAERSPGIQPAPKVLTTPELVRVAVKTGVSIGYNGHRLGKTEAEIVAELESQWGKIP